MTNNVKINFAKSGRTGNRRRLSSKKKSRSKLSVCMGPISQTNCFTCKIFHEHTVLLFTHLKIKALKAHFLRAWLLQKIKLES
jgi:hypothetical protein